MKPPLPALGAVPIDERNTSFTVWAPNARRLSLLLPERGRVIPMTAAPHGYHFLTTDAPAGSLYQFQFDDGRRRPDPASRAQPSGVHGPSAVVAPPAPDPSPWLFPPLYRHVLYELHVGAFTPDGTFDAIIPRLDALRDLGVTAVELMPVAQFPGDRNWGYDGVCPFAAHSAYGGPDALRGLVAACHARDLGVVLDVVYNHLGPEGNYLSEFGPYFTDRYKTPWGAAINFDAPHSDHVREFFIQNALYWTMTVGIDALRLDAVHAINDHTATPFLLDLSRRVHGAAERAGRRVALIAESSDNDPRLVRPEHAGGLALDACWNDDFHHAIRAALTAEARGYYRAFGRASQVAKCLRDRYVFDGEHSEVFQRRHGAPAPDVPHSRLVVFTQNHDHVGNRPFGDRLDATAGADGARVAAALVLLSPFTPMLFMGEEYGESSPFQYFVDHSDPALVDAVRRGRRDEFPELHDADELPDPQCESTFRDSMLDWARRESPAGAGRLRYYAALMRLRRELDIASPACAAVHASARDDPATVCVVHGAPPRAAVVANLGASPTVFDFPVADPARWTIILDSGDTAFGGSGAAASLRGGSLAISRRTAVVLAPTQEHV